jgi:hypothetical protein
MESTGIGSMLSQMLKDFPKMSEPDKSGGSGPSKANYSMIPGFDNFTKHIKPATN